MWGPFLYQDFPHTLLQGLEHTVLFLFSNLQHCCFPSCSSLFKWRYWDSASPWVVLYGITYMQGVKNFKQFAFVFPSSTNEQHFYRVRKMLLQDTRRVHNFYYYFYISTIYTSKQRAQAQAWRRSLCVQVLQGDDCVPNSDHHYHASSLSALPVTNSDSAMICTTLSIQSFNLKPSWCHPMSIQVDMTLSAEKPFSMSSLALTCPV